MQILLSLSECLPLQSSSWRTSCASPCPTDFARLALSAVCLVSGKLQDGDKVHLKENQRQTFVLLLLLKVAPSESGGELCLTTMLCFVLGMLLLVVTREQWLCTREWDLALHFNMLAGVRHPDFTEN